MIITYFPRDMRPIPGAVFQADGRILWQADRKLTTPELLKIFRGWFTMRYFATMKRDKVKNYHPDLYLITKNLHDVPRKQWPPYNEIASNLFHQEIYGIAMLVKDKLV